MAELPTLSRVCTVLDPITREPEGDLVLHAESVPSTRSGAGASSADLDGDHAESQ
jgi:hypothetical protein